MCIYLYKYVLVFMLVLLFFQMIKFIEFRKTCADVVLCASVFKLYYTTARSGLNMLKIYTVNKSQFCLAATEIEMHKNGPKAANPSIDE